MEQGDGRALHSGPATADAAAPDEFAPEWQPAALGHGALPFHRASGANGARAWRAGRDPGAMVVGGFLQSVTGTEAGVMDAWATLPGHVRV